MFTRGYPPCRWPPPAFGAGKSAAGLRLDEPRPEPHSLAPRVPDTSAGATAESGKASGRARWHEWNPPKKGGGFPVGNLDLLFFMGHDNGSFQDCAWSWSMSIMDMWLICLIVCVYVPRSNHYCYSPNQTSPRTAPSADRWPKTNPFPWCDVWKPNVPGVLSISTWRRETRRAKDIASWRHCSWHRSAIAFFRVPPSTGSKGPKGGEMARFGLAKEIVKTLATCLT